MTLTLTGAPVFIALFVLAMMILATHGPASAVGDWARRAVSWIALVSLVITLVVAILAIIHV